MMSDFPVGIRIRPCNYSDDPIEFAKVMREALDRAGWFWDISGKVNRSRLDGKAQQIGQRFNKGFGEGLYVPPFVPKLRIYKGDICYINDVEYRRMEFTSHVCPYSIEVEIRLNPPIVYHYIVSSHDCDQLLAASHIATMKKG